jgi:pimeloyl-ACP methyl ester carboxylesterase
MPSLERDNGTAIYYEEHGSGFPLLTFAPGGMRSSIPFWDRAPFHPVREFAPEFRVITFDQRNAGQSRAPVTEHDGWAAYTEDHLALLDHLGIERCHMLGGCIGGAFALALAHAAPQRVTAAVIQQSIGLGVDNREVFYELFDSWAKDLAPHKPEVGPAAWRAFRERMYASDFVFSASRDQVRALPTPLLVLMGNDIYHPSEISRELCALAQNARLIERWKDAEVVSQTVREVRAFLQLHTPRNS